MTDYPSIPHKYQNMGRSPRLKGFASSKFYQHFS